jgi:hypothetical protein
MIRLPSARAVDRFRGFVDNRNSTKSTGRPRRKGHRPSDLGSGQQSHPGEEGGCSASVWWPFRPRRSKGLWPAGRKPRWPDASRAGSDGWQALARAAFRNAAGSGCRLPEGAPHRRGTTTQTAAHVPRPLKLRGCRKLGSTRLDPPFRYGSEATCGILELSEVNTRKRFTPSRLPSPPGLANDLAET